MKTLYENERDFIIQALELHRYNRTHTAKALAICIRTLRNKIERYRNEGFSIPDSSPHWGG